MLAIETKSIINEALSQALQLVAFLDVAPYCQLDMQLPPKIVAAEIGFSGPFTGTIRMVAGHEFARMFAENMSGMDDIEDDQCVDAVKELLNITCGLVLPMISPTTADEFDMTVPHVTDVLPDDFQQFVLRDDVMVVDVEDHLVAVQVTFEQ